MKKNCIIIGSGLGGLSCGVILAKNGYHVTVLEQGNQIGGCLQCFTRKGAKFETGMHFIGSASRGQTLHRLLTFLGIYDKLRLKSLSNECYDIVSLAGQRFNFSSGREPFIETMSGYFPTERDNLNRYMNIVENVASASSFHSLKYADTNYAVNSYYQTISINSVLDSLFNDEILKNVLSGTIPLYAACKDKTPFSQHAFIMNFYNQSAYRIVNGSDAIASELTKIIKSYGGNVFTNSKVTKILCNSEKAIGVEINYSDFLAADNIISTIHPTRLIEITSTHLLRPAFKQRLISLENTVSCFSLYLKFKPDSVKYLNSNFYGYRENNPWECEKYTDKEWPKGYLYLHMCHEDEPKFARNGVILSYMNMSDVAEWKGTTIGKRGSEYASFKEEKAKKLINCLEKDFPRITNSIEEYYTSTPLTYLDYTGTEDGAMYGVAKDISKGIAARVPHKTRIPNLFLAGQNVNSHGILGVLVGSIVACSELVGIERIYKQISESC